jgi:UTP:GlnB (protein PII) uridylyltransferase
MALWRIRATVDDRPGYLAVLTASLALKSVNILTVQVHTTEAGAVDEFLVDAPESFTRDELVEAVRRGRGRDTWVARSDARGLIDEPTRVLGLAARVAADPHELAHALDALLGDCEISRGRAGANTRVGCTADVMVLTDPAGGALVIRREGPSFTPAEFARAHALVEVAAAGAGLDAGTGALDGTPQ